MAEIAEHLSIINSLPWNALKLDSRETPWPELRILADAAAVSHEARERLRAEADRAMDTYQEQARTKDINLADMMAPVVYVLAAEKMDEESKVHAGRCLLHILYRAGQLDSDWALEIAMFAGQRLGSAVVKPAVELAEQHDFKDLECWFHLMPLLNMAKDTDAQTRSQVAQYCRRVFFELRDESSWMSPVVFAANALGDIGDVESLPMLKRSFKRTRQPDVGRAIRQLEGVESLGPDERQEKSLEWWVEDVVAQANECRERQLKDENEDDEDDLLDDELDPLDDDDDCDDGLGRPPDVGRGPRGAGKTARNYI